MVNRYVFAVAGLAAQLNALPLNINLGAYSPALVVGDGEISFGGRNDVSQLMNVLEGAAVNAAQGVANAPAAPANPQPQQPAQPATPAAPAAASVGGATPVTATSENGRVDEAQAIAALQGMGKEIAPRVSLTKARAPPPQKRDLAGFDRALKFAEAALSKGPKVQLGTGEGGSGVGMIIDNNQQAAARPGKGGAEGGAAGGGAAGGGAAGGGAGEAAAPAAAPPAAAAPVIVAQQKVKARAEEPQQAPRRRKVTTMYVRSGVPAGVEMTPEKLVARDPMPAGTPVARQVTPATNEIVKRAEEELAKRGAGGAIDTVNLNVSGEGVTMTFVESEAAEDEQ